VKQVFSFGGQIVVMDVPAPCCGDNEVLVRNAFSVISSGTETTSLSGSAGGMAGLARRVKDDPQLVQKALDMIRREGLGNTWSTVRGQIGGRLAALGYSTSGIVAEVGRKVTDIAVGDAVACAGAGRANHAELVAVPRNLVCPIPDGAGLSEAAFTTLGAIALQGVRRARVQLGDRVVIIGLGLLGQIGCQILKASGAYVIGIDTVLERVELAREMGSDAAFVSADDTVSQVMTHTAGAGADAVIIYAATKSSEPVRRAMEMARKKGRVIVVGAVGMELVRSPFYEKELDFLISCSCGPGRYDPTYEEAGIDYPIAYVRWTENRNMQAFLELVAQKRIGLERLTEHVFAIEDAAEAYGELTAGANRPVAILLKYPLAGTTGTEIPRVIGLKPLEKASGRINVGVIGAGRFAQAYHLPNLKAAPFFSIRAIAARTGATARSMAEKYGAQYCSTDYRDILRDKDIDLALIATRHNLHAPLIVEAAEAGKHVFIEKPIALTYEQCRSVHEAVAGGKINLAVGFNRRFAPLAQRMKSIAERRVSPAVVSIRVNSADMKAGHWINDPDEGGGAIVGEGCHFFDFLAWLIGSEPKTIYAGKLSSSNPAVIDENNMVCSLTYEDGSVASLVYTTIGNHSFSKERIEVFMDGGVLVLDDFRTLTIVGLGAKGSTLPRTNKGQLELLHAYGSFLSGQAGSGDLPTVLDGVRATVCSLKALDALRTGQVQQFSYPF